MRLMRLAERPHDLKLTVPLVGAELIGVETPVGIPQAERLLAPEVVDADAHACAASHRGAPVSSVNVVALYNPVGLGFSGGASSSMGASTVVIVVSSQVSMPSRANSARACSVMSVVPEQSGLDLREPLRPAVHDSWPRD